MRSIESDEVIGDLRDSGAGTAAEVSERVGAGVKRTAEVEEALDALVAQGLATKSDDPVPVYAAA
jgi:hypothetical protein